MADKVVQLKDKNSNNLYPVAGSALTNSVSTGAIVDNAVTTNKIADASVTNAKIDWSTIWTYTNTDPGEGGSLAANSFIGVYE